MSNDGWRAVNSAHWDEKVVLHLGPRGYDLTSLRGRDEAVSTRLKKGSFGQSTVSVFCTFNATSVRTV
jgi:hypothetical protein